MSYIPNVRAYICSQRKGEGIEVPGLIVENVSCARMFEPTVFLDAFLRKADGVLVIGCRTGECRNTASKVHNVRKIELLRELIDGTNHRGRMLVHWYHSAEAHPAAEMAEEFVRELGERGPVHLSQALEMELCAMQEMLEAKRVQNFVAKYHQLVEKNNVFGEKLVQAEVDAGLQEAVRAEYERALIRNAALRRPSTVEEAAAMFGLPPHEVLRHVTAMLRRNALEIASIEDNVPRYRAVTGEGGK